MLFVVINATCNPIIYFTRMTGFATWTTRSSVNTPTVGHGGQISFSRGPGGQISSGGVRGHISFSRGQDRISLHRMNHERGAPQYRGISRVMYGNTV